MTDNHTTFTVEYDWTEQADVLAAALTGNDDDALLEAERAFNERVRQITGTDPEVRFDLSDALRDLVKQHRQIDPELLACPQCGETDSLGTAEVLTGWAGARFIIDPDGNRTFEHGGYTEVHWDSSQSVGIHCRACDWGIETYDDDDGAPDLEALNPRPRSRPMTDATNLTYAEVADTTAEARRKGAAAAERVADEVSGMALLMWHVLDLGPADWFEALHPADEAVLDANDSPYTDAPHADAWATTFWEVLTERASAQWDAETRVERGARLLDEKHPGWWDEIDLDHLVMSSPCMCVIGQVLGDYFWVDMLGLGTKAEAEDHGFDTASVPFSPPHGPAASERDFALLDEEWRSSILSRRSIPPR